MPCRLPNLAALLACLALVAMFCTRTARAAETDTLYGKTIIVSTSEKPGESLAKAITHLRETLKEVTGEEFALGDPVSPDPSGAEPPAIVIATSDSPMLSDVIRRRVSGQTSERAVLLRSSESGHRLWIVAPRQSGLESGIYLYLEELGCRWFTSAKDWSILPRRSDIRVQLDLLTREASTVWPAVALDRRDYSRKLSTYGRFESGRKRVGTGDPSPQVFVRGDMELALEAQGGQSSIAINLCVKPVEAGALAQEAPRPTLSLCTVDGRVVSQAQPRADAEWEEVTLKIPRPGAYRIRLANASLTGLQAPPRFYLCLTSFRGQTLDAWRSRLYFFVPKGMTRAAIYSHSIQPVTIYDPQGNPVELARRTRLIAFDVPAGMDGRAWSITDETSTRDLEMLNLPPYLSLFPDALLIPENTDRRSLK